jgi:2-methylisocitrate lyase-like PEP mutase family enzyme
MVGIAEVARRCRPARGGRDRPSTRIWNPATNSIDAIDVATERVRAAATSAGERGLVLTAGCEKHLHGDDDFADTLARPRGYLTAGAEVLYAPMLWAAEQIGPVAALGAPVNVLLLPGGPSVAKLAGRGARRVSVGGSLANITEGAMVASAEHLLAHGTFDADTPFIPDALKQKALTAG